MRKTNSTNFLNEVDLQNNCGMFYTLSLIGARWKMSILALLLDNKILRYVEIKKKLNGITERMLIKQLKELQANQLITRKTYDGTARRVEYAISPLGESLKNILLAMEDWGKINKPPSKKKLSEMAVKAEV